MLLHKLVCDICNTGSSENSEEIYFIVKPIFFHVPEDEVIKQVSKKLIYKG